MVSMNKIVYLNLKKKLSYLIIITTIMLLTSCDHFKSVFFSSTENTPPTATKEIKILFLLYATFDSLPLANRTAHVLSQHYPEQQVFIKKLITVHPDSTEKTIQYQVLIGPITSKDEAQKIINTIPPWIPYQPRLIEVNTSNFHSQ